MLGQRLEVRQGQGLVITPQLQQAIKLLQLSNQELEAFVEAELERNPLLKRDEEGDGPSESTSEAPAEAASDPHAELSFDEARPDAAEQAMDTRADDVYDASPGERATEGPGGGADEAQPGLSDWSRTGKGGPVPEGEGMERADSEAVLNRLFDLTEDPANIYEHVWRPGDLVMWDNLCSCHARTDFAGGQRRLLRRCTVEGSGVLRENP